MTKQIKSNIRKFVKSIDEELSVTFIEGVGYYFETATNTINIDFTEIDDCGFMRHLKEVHKCRFAYNYSLILWSILHEIGHYETEWELLENEDESDLRELLSCTDESCRHDTFVQDLYFNLTAEWIATEWAIEWIKENKKLVEKFKI